jgi:RNA polymerase II subunit A small phosphatase-like protein/CTD small phosphatase-like protein 2
LDETLIHSELERTSPEDEEIVMKIGNSIEKYYLKLRPYVREFLRHLS